MKNKIILLIILAAALTVTAAAQAPAKQTNEELKKQVADAEERVALKRRLLQAQQEEADIDKQLSVSKTPAAQEPNSQTAGTEGGRPRQQPLGAGPTPAGDPNSAVTTATPMKMSLVKASLAAPSDLLPVNNAPVNNTALNNTPGKTTLTKAALTKPAAAQTNTNSNCLVTSTNEIENALCDLAGTLVDRQNTPNHTTQFDLSTDSSLLNEMLLKAMGADNAVEQSAVKFLMDEEANRTDKQAGGDSKIAGSTSLVVKGGVPAFLSWAQENGGVESGRDGNTVTFRANPVGLGEALLKKGNYFNINPLVAGPADQILQNFFRDDDKFTDFMRNTSIGLSFDLTRGDGTAAAPVFTGTRQQLSAVSVRHQFFNGRDPRNPKYKADWLDFARTAGQSLLKQNITAFQDLIDPVDGTIYRSPELEKWRTDTETLVANAVQGLQDTNRDIPDNKKLEAQDAIYDVLSSQIAKIPTSVLKQDTELVAALNGLGTGLTSFIAAKQKLLDNIEKGNVFSVEYTNYREVTKPDLSNFRAIFSHGLGGGSDLTFNASLTMFNKKPVLAVGSVKTSRIRDFDFGLQLDMPFSIFNNNRDAADRKSILATDLSTPLFGNPVLTFAGKYQRLQSDVPQDNGVVIGNTRGDLAFGQIKLTIPINFAGFTINLPISASFANRTDLIKEKDIRGNFGFTMDINPFFSMLKNTLSGNLFRP